MSDSLLNENIFALITEETVERLKQIQIPTLKYRRLRGDMTEVFKIVHNYYDSEAAVKMNFNTFNTTRVNMYKLQKFVSL